MGPPGYAPPSGPPPSYTAHNQDYAPPPGPPPSGGANGPSPYAHWTDVEDTSLLPPPPVLDDLHTTSTVNASADSAERAAAWCRANQLYVPRPLLPRDLDIVRQGSLSLLQPANMDAVMTSRGPGSTHVQSGFKCDDTLLLTNLPLFASAHDNPSRTEKPKTVYYEIIIKSIGSSRHPDVDSGIAIGYVAPPYPPWRLPGWQRGSMSVMSDDGRRYIDDDGGGQDFVEPFVAGDTVGFGVRFNPPQNGNAHNDVQVFFTRNGKETNAFDLHEPRDSDDPGTIIGLDGTCDLLGAIGFYGHVEFDVHFRHDQWSFRP